MQIQTQVLWTSSFNFDTVTVKDVWSSANANVDTSRSSAFSTNSFFFGSTSESTVYVKHFKNLPQKTGVCPRYIFNIYFPTQR